MWAEVALNVSLPPKIAEFQFSSIILVSKILKFHPQNEILIYKMGLIYNFVLHKKFFLLHKILTLLSKMTPKLWRLSALWRLTQNQKY